LRTVGRLIVCLVSVLLGAGHEGLAHGEEHVPSPWVENLGYAPPVPGSYRLPVLSPAADGTAVAAGGEPVSLHSLFAGKIALLSFIYTQCSDARGCPMATRVLHEVEGAMQDEPELRANLRLVSLSFDPRRDTPEVMAGYAGGRAMRDSGWQFLTTATQEDLKAILDGYGQYVVPERDAQGTLTGNFAHVLKVYLIDRQQRVRNIYSVSFLHPALVINDVKTLLLEEREGGTVDDGNRFVAASHVGPDELPEAVAAVLRRSEPRKADARSGTPYAEAPPGAGQHSTHPPTASDAGADLLAGATNPPLGLPPIPVPADNPLTEAKVRLGRKLFFDRRLSLNHTMSCAMCHIPDQGFTSNELATAVGIEGRTVRRNSPTIYNVAYLEHLFHDGRDPALETQILGPMLAANEMGNPSIGWVLARIRAMPDYHGLFEAAFGRPADVQTLGQAIASYERTLVSAASPFDRWYYGEVQDAMSPAAIRGFELFRGAAGCVACHPVGEDYALFTDQSFHNTGLGWHNAMAPEPESRPVQLAPGVEVNVASAIIDSVAERPPADLGRYEVTQDPADRWRYRTPSLRNVALTAPYMHDGSLATLQEVVAFYNQGGHPHELIDPLIRPLRLSQDDRAALVEFLNALTGDNVQALVADGLAAPRGDMAPGSASAARSRH
jgi:cytochrome c peroxidase